MIVNNKEIENNTSQLLRFTTAGNVDDGKSTLIGRLLYDSKAIFEDQLEAVAARSKKNGYEGIDLALFTDGLRDERAQGITIDVAYRYFTTPKRKFIIADTPGHLQYTRNMVTGASTAHVALILVDARKGITEQTKRHAFIASLLHISHIIICINKMDLADWSEEVYNDIRNQFEAFASKLTIKDIRFIPISALLGDNVVNRSQKMNWYQDASLLHTLETLHISNDSNKTDARFPVQTVLRSQNRKFSGYRGYAGQIAGGIFRKGDKVTVLPSGFSSIITSIAVYEKSFNQAHAPMSVTITLKDDIDVSRGDMIVHTNSRPKTLQELQVMLCWLGDHPAKPNARYNLCYTTNIQKAMIKEVMYKIDINTLGRNTEDKAIIMNDICKVRIKTSKPLMTDPYSKNKTMGSLILIDEQTNETVAAGMIL